MIVITTRNTPLIKITLSIVFTVFIPVGVLRRGCYPYVFDMSSIFLNYFNCL